MVMAVDMSRVTIPEESQRKVFAEVEIQSLADSIADPDIGLLNPLLVTEQPNQEDVPLPERLYELVAGRRRFKALKLLGQDYKFGDRTIAAGRIPVVLYVGDEVGRYKAELTENLERVDLDWKDQVEAQARLKELEEVRRRAEGSSDKVTDTELASLISKGEKVTSHDRVKIAQNTMVHRFMDRPSVRKAGNIKQAVKAAQREAALEFEKLSQAQVMDATDFLEVPAETKPSSGDIASDMLNSLQPKPEPIPLKKTEHILYEGDMREQIKRVRAEHPATFSGIVCDPPYGVKVGEWGSASSVQHHYVDDDVNYKELHEELLLHLNAICKPNAHAYVFCSFEYFPELKAMFEERDWWVRKRPLIWNKGSVGHLIDGTPQGWRHCYEHILFAKRGNLPSADLMDDVLSVNPNKFRLNAAEKPADLILRLMNQSFMQGDTVFDPFCGAGATFTVGNILGVNVVGIEKDQQMIEYSKKAIGGKSQDMMRVELMQKMKEAGEVDAET